VRPPYRAEEYLSRLAVALLAGALAVPAAAQNAESEADRRVQEAITRQVEAAGLARKRCLQGSSPAEAIIVCAPLDPEENRLPLRRELDSARSTDDGLPRAPDVAGRGIIKGPPTVSNLCVIPPCPGAPVYLIDIESLPEAPRGSDAERIGKGEIIRP
jgi:hypothetical protein